jgi:hypothetical protein
VQHRYRVDVAHPDPFGHLDDRRRIVQDRAHASSNQQIGDLLGVSGGHRQDRQLDPLVADHRRDLVGAHDRQPVDLLADLGRVVVEQRSDADALAAEAFVARDRLAEVADAYQRHRPFVLQPQNVLDLIEELLNVVADALLAEFAEIREVLADLRGGHVDALAELLRRYRGAALLQ